MSKTCLNTFSNFCNAMNSLKYTSLCLTFCSTLNKLLGIISKLTSNMQIYTNQLTSSPSEIIKKATLHAST